ncbi:flagellar motor protein MotB [Candidatus Omnitrophota bacterium]
MRKIFKIVCVVLMIPFLFVGCAQNRELIKSNARQRALIQSLSSEVERLQQELDKVSEMGAGLEQTKLELEEKLKAQVQQGDLAVTLDDRGVVVTILNKILFESGKTDIKESAKETLSLLSSSIRNLAEGQVVYIEGHTDSDPILKSGFKSNWELSTARATEVIHYVVDNFNVDPQMLVASGYGEFRAVASNATVEGKAKNRRVEVIISPKPRLYVTQE